MWDSQYRLTAQTSSWCGMASVSGAGFLSKVSTSTSGSSGGFRQNDPGLRRWQSLSHLEPESPAQSLCSLGTELRGAPGEGKYRQPEVVQWLQDAHECLDTQLECLRSRDAQLSYHRSSAQLLDMKHRQLSEAMRSLEREEEAANLSQFENNQRRSELHEKVLRLEKDLMQVRLSLGSGSSGQLSEQTPGALPESRDDSNRQKDILLCDAETRGSKQEKEQNQATEQLQRSAETPRLLLNQIEQLNQRLSHTVKNHSELQERLTEANNKISQACLEKAILSTQVLKLEDIIKDLKTQLPEALSDKRNLTQEEAGLRRGQVLVLQLEKTKTGSEDAEIHTNESQIEKQGKETALMKEGKVNEKLTCELEMIKQKLEILQSQLQELTAEKAQSSTQITDLEAQNSQLIREKEELLSKMNESGHEMKDKCCQLRESLEALQLEKQKLQDQCLCLEAKLLESEEKLQKQAEEYEKNDTVKIQNMEELKAVASHWTEKWQQAALTLQFTQEELDTLKKRNGRNEKESDSLLKVELDACKQQLELGRSRSHTLLHRFNKDKAGEAVQAQDKETETDLSESSLSWEPPPDDHSSQNTHPQVCMENRGLPWLKVKLAEKEKLLQEKTEALMSLEMLREMEKTEAQIKISALELKLREKPSEETTGSLKAQLEESRRRMNQLQQEKTLLLQRLQTLQQLYPIKDEKQSFEGRKEKPVCPAGLETDQQRRMINEQLKNLFKEREGKTTGKTDNTTAAATAAQTDTFSHQDQTHTPKAERTPVDRWTWQLMPVYEEDEEDEELPGIEEEETEEEAPAQESLRDQRHKMSAANVSLKAKHENRLQDLRSKHKIQHLDATAEEASLSSNADLPNLGSDEFDLHWKPSLLSPDGIFVAERVDICSPDVDEEEGEHE